MKEGDEPTPPPEQTAPRSTSHLSATETGERLFARFAYAPNALGHCGPAAAERLLAIARGEEKPGDLTPIASRFSGAWVYQVVLGQMLDLDPLSPEIVTGYWIGSEAVDRIDRADFLRRLLAVIDPRAGSYWSHLDDTLLPEATGTHAFHVLAVYPWSRLAPTGRPEPLAVLNGCLIRPGVVHKVEEKVNNTDHAELHVTVRTRSLTWSDGFRWDEEEMVATVPFGDHLAPGDYVGLHWGQVCVPLTLGEATALDERLDEQIALMSHRHA
ncbi:MAG: DUF6390 family protein [Propionibacteriaceae bacterium]|nr:DUF6390 family protein [Propionibacteriaceae bacterium]